MVVDLYVFFLLVVLVVVVVEPMMEIVIAFASLPLLGDCLLASPALTVLLVVVVDMVLALI